MSEEEQNLTKDPDVNPVNKLETNPDQVGTNLEQFRTNLDQLGTTADIDPDIGDFDQAQALADIGNNIIDNKNVKLIFRILFSLFSGLIVSILASGWL